jgi:hypothetical protein
MKCRRRRAVHRDAMKVQRKNGSLPLEASRTAASERLASSNHGSIGLANLWRTWGVTTFNKSGHLLLTWIVGAALVGVRGRTKWTQARCSAAPPPAQYANRPEGLRWPGVHFSPRSLWDNSISAAEDMVSAASSNNRFKHANSQRDTIEFEQSF